MKYIGNNVFKGILRVFRISNRKTILLVQRFNNKN